MVCLRYYQGEGFPESYRENLRCVVNRARQQGVRVVLGPDEVCSHCPSLKEGSCSHGPGWEEEIRAMDEAAMGLLGLKPHQKISWEELGARVRSCLFQWKESFCRGCPWKEACQENESYREEKNP